MSEPDRVNQDAEHLKLLGIFHYICAGMVALFACFPIIHLVLGIMMLANPRVFGPAKDQPPIFVAWFFVIIASGIILAGWTFAGSLAWSARCLGRRQHYSFCLIMAGVACIFMPVGTVLGVFTIIVLMRPSVKALFGFKATAAPLPAGSAL